MTLSELLCNYTKHPMNSPKTLTISDGTNIFEVVLYVQDIDGVDGDNSATRIEAILSEKHEYIKKWG